MKRLLVVGGALGLVLAVVIIANEGFGAVTAAFAAVGLGLAVIVLIRAFELAAAGLGWWAIFPPAAKPALLLCLHVRFVREAINVLLPVAQIGGDIAGARLMSLSGTSPAVAGATVLVDVLVQAVSLFLFTLTGIGIFALGGAGGPLLESIVIGAFVMGVALAAFFIAQRFGGARLVDRALMALADKFGWSALIGVANLHDNLVRIYADLPRLGAGLLVHVVVWFAGALEVLLALHLMGHPISVADAIVIESIGQAVRAAAFVVPGALGVQEAGFVAICAAFGIPAAPALALSLVKRVPELILGPPFLFIWHAQEARALRKRRQAG